MSTDLLFRASLSKPANRYPNIDGKFVVAFEAGSNNTIDMCTNKPARDWACCFMGTHTQIMQQACDWACGVEGGTIRGSEGLPWKGQTAESFLRFVRRVLDGQPLTSTYWRPEVKPYAITPAIERDLQARGIKLGKSNDLWQKRESVLLPDEHASLIFDWKVSHGISSFDLASIVALSY